MYLVNCITNGYVHRPERIILEELLEEYGITLIGSVAAGNLNSCITFSYEGRSFHLNEFPGNCSSLILHNITDMLEVYTDRAKIAIQFCSKLGSCLEYGALFISGSTKGSYNILVNELGFTCCLDGIFNPHSERKNWFVYKVLPKKDSV